MRIPLHTLAQLKAGQLGHITRLQLSENLTEFPVEILTLADSLEILDLSNNQLSHLPDSITQLHKLKIIFASNNLFTELPAILGQCPNLEMIGFKSNQIKHVPNESLPPKLRWLILTDNQITAMPSSLGERPRLQKLALAGNRLTSLPASLANANNLELIRLSANQLTEFPTQLLNLPKLAWLAFAGNPFGVQTIDASVPKINASDYQLEQVLGQGASGIISKAKWLNNPHQFTDQIAVKVFKGEITSDGYPQDELNACLKTGSHPNLVKSLAQVDDNQQLALVMELIPAHYANLGLPPSLASCTRDTFEQGFALTIKQIHKIVMQMADLVQHLQQQQVCHGDLYAHNVLFDEQANIIFGDFGAASIYNNLPIAQQQAIAQIEQRAFSYFIEDLLSVCRPISTEAEQQLLEEIKQL